MFGSEIQFALPQMGLLLLLIFPFLYSVWSLKNYRHRQQEAYNPFPLMKRLLHPRSQGIQFAKGIGWTMIWILSSFVLMDPFGNVRYSPFEGSNSTSQTSSSFSHTIIFLVDTSASMGIPDGLDGQTRLEEAKNLMQDVIRQLHGQLISLFAFTSELTPVVPPTLDYIFTRLAIKDLQINQGDVGGTRFAPVLETLKKTAFPSPTAKRFTVLLLTDGGDTELESLKGEAVIKEKEAILTAIPNPQEFHVHLYPIGIGSLQLHPIPNVTFNGHVVSSKLEENILKQLALQDKGVYYKAEDWSSWDLAKELVRQINSTSFASQDSIDERHVLPIKKEDVIVDLYYQIPLGIALLFYCLILFLPDVRKEHR